MKKVNKKLRIALTVLICCMAIPAFGFIILSWAVLPPKKLTPMVLNLASEYLDADLQCDRIELTYLETFPHLGITLTNGRMISLVAKDSLAEDVHFAKTDTLIAFNKCVISLAPSDYLFGGKIGISNISIDTPQIYGYINKKGKANWDIYTDTTATDSTSTLPPIDLKHVQVNNGNITYYDSEQQQYAKIEGFFLSLDGALTQGGNKLEIETGWKSLQYLSPEYSMDNHMELQVDTKLELSDNYNRVKFTDTEVFINKLPFTLAGYVFNDTANKCLDMNLEYGLKVPDLNSLLEFIPDEYMKPDAGTQATGTIELSGNIRGQLGDSIYPVISACCKLENGSLYGKTKDQGIDSLSLDIDLYLDMANSDTSFIELSEMMLKAKNLSFDMKGRVSDILNNPDISASLKGDINFSKLSKRMIPEDTLSMDGIINVDMETRFKANDIIQSNFGKIFAKGSMNIDNFKAVSKPYDINMVITKASLDLDSETKSEKFLNGQKLLTGKLSIDSLNIKWKDEIVTLLSNLKVTLSAPPTADTTAVVPMGGLISFNHLRTLLPDSVWLWAGKTEIKGGIKPSASNKKTPEIASVISVDSLAYIYTQYKSALLLTQSQFNMKAFPYKTDTTGFMKRRAQQAMMQQDSSMVRNMRAKRDTSLMLSGSSSQLLRAWDVKGNVVFTDLKASSPFFPVKMQMQGTNVQFSTNDVKLSGAKVLLGKSDLTLSGEITNMRRAFLRGGKLTANLNVNANYIDCNEMMNALSNGMLYSEQREMEKAANTSTEGFMNFQAATESVANIQTDTTNSGVFVLPQFLDLTLNTDAKRIDFNDLNLEKVKGEVILRDQNIQLTNLTMHSNIGCGSLTMVYTAKEKSKASTGFDLKMDEIQVDKLIDLFPAIDTLMPMLRSFEGIVDCQIAATCEMDSSMSIILPSIYSACYMHGTNMVLLDGETFAEISKTLMFKNKKQNKIDNIAVELVIKDSKIDVFPFLVEMDRYRVAVGGTHNMDMTFNYHISVLKSPVPFKLGIDVTGNLDDFKYKITKCRYKDIFKPAKTSTLDSTTVNIRKNIYEAIHKRIYTSLFDKGTTPADSTELNHQHNMAEAILPEKHDSIPGNE